MEGLEERLQRQMTRTPALKLLLQWLAKHLREAVGLDSLKEGLITGADFNIEATTDALNTILKEHPGNALARISLGMLCYSGAAQSVNIPKSANEFIGSMMAVRLFYEYVAFVEKNAGYQNADDKTQWKLSSDDIASDEVVAGFTAGTSNPAAEASAKRFVQLLITSYTSSGNTSSQNPHGVSYELGAAAEVCDAIMSKFSTVFGASFGQIGDRIQTILNESAAKANPKEQTAEDVEVAESEAALETLKAKLAAMQKELALAETRQTTATAELQKGSSTTGEAKRELQNLEDEKVRVNERYAPTPAPAPGAAPPPAAPAGATATTETNGEDSTETGMSPTPFEPTEAPPSFEEAGAESHDEFDSEEFSDDSD
jgi:hypothetical protein